ncbi:MAG: hypothetical protein HY717_19875 [Planctomycetes bacterium]|nr:hypothetical protein [Planctomycetota bacterium]
MQHLKMASVVGVAVFLGGVGCNLAKRPNPEVIEMRFCRELDLLEKLASGGREVDEEVKKAFESPDIHGAFVVNKYINYGRALTLVKNYSDEFSNAEKHWHFRSNPSLQAPVVNVIGEFALYEKQLKTQAEELKGYEIAVSLKALED